MKVNPLAAPLAGERVLGTDPKLLPQIDAGWRRRSQFLTGRSVSERMLQAEQAERAGRLALRGQQVSPGVVSGLVATLERLDGRDVIRVSAGYGLCFSGEDVLLPHELVFRVTDLVDGTPPPLSVLVLQPVDVHGQEGEPGDLCVSDPCEAQPGDHAFDDVLRTDAARPVLVPWSLRSLDLRSATSRNEAAWAAFELERTRDPESPLPWEDRGVPIAMLALDAGGVLWLDRASVVRAGGRPQRRTRLPGVTGHPPLWRARMEQFREHLAEVEGFAASTALRGTMRWLPPVGLLPRELLDLDARRIPCLPRTIAVEAAPVPLEQLDAIVRGAASLAPYDLARGGDEMKLWVPVPQRYFEPDLLQVELPRAEFQQAIDEATDRRAAALRRRLDLRERARALAVALDPSSGVPTWPDPDPLALDAEELALVPPRLWQRKDALAAIARLRAGTLTLTSSADLRALFSGLLGADAGGAAAGLLDKLGKDARPIVLTEDSLTAPIADVDLGLRWTGGQMCRFMVADEARRETVQSGPLAFQMVEGALSATQLDDALAWASTRPLFIIATGIDDAAVEVLERRVLAGQPLPVVVRAPSGDLSEWWGDVGAMASARRDRSAVWRSERAVRFAWSSPTEASFTGTDSQAARQRMRTIRLQIEAATDDATREALQARLAALAGGVGLLRLPAGDNALRTWRDATFALDFVHRLLDATPPATDAGWRDLLLAASLDDEALYDTDFGDESMVSTAAAGLYARLQESPGGLSAAEIAELPGRGLVGFARYLQAKADAADDFLDLSSIKAQAGIFRIREQMLGRDKATRMATSPVLALAAEKLPADATVTQLSSFLAGLTKTPDSGGGTGGTGGTGGGGGGQTVNWREFGKSTYGKKSQVILPSAMHMATRSAPRMAAAPTSARVFSAAREAFTGAASATFAGDAPRTAASYSARGAGVAERLEAPRSVEVRYKAFETKVSIYQGISKLDLNLDDVAFPGFLDGDTAVDRPLKGADAAGNLQELADFEHDVVSDNADEATLFQNAVDSLEATLSSLRLVEARIAAYKRVIAECNELAEAVRADAALVRARLDTLEQTLAEARHDLSVARSLLAEEQARVDSINQWRAAILARFVPFLAWSRPRVVDLVDAAPDHDVEPRLTVSPVPAALSRPAAAPDELRELVELLREAPARWFPTMETLLDRVDRLERLRGAVVAAQARAARSLAVPQVAPAEGQGLGPRIALFTHVRRLALLEARKPVAALDPSVIQKQSWQTIRAAAGRTVSLGDLIESVDVRAELSREAAELLERVFRVSAALVEAMEEVEPSIRLTWAERLSEYDAPVDLRRLSSLPRWQEVGRQDRLRRQDPLQHLELQALVDWLYTQIDPTDGDALAFGHDLVRTCILLASHAPVDRIVAAVARASAPLRLDQRIPLILDLRRVRVGMTVLVQRANAVIARAIIEDLGDGEAVARVVHTANPSAVLGANERVQVLEPDGVGLTGAGIGPLHGLVQTRRGGAGV